MTLLSWTTTLKTARLTTLTQLDTVEQLRGVEQHHGDRKNPGWHHWSKCALRLGRDTHIPALSAPPEFEITAVCASRHETLTKRSSISGLPMPLPALAKWFSIPTWTSSRSACECLFTISWGWPLCTPASISIANRRLLPPLSRLNGCLIWPSLEPPRGGTASSRGPRVQSRQRPGRQWIRWQGAFVHDDRIDANVGHRIHA